MAARRVERAERRGMRARLGPMVLAMALPLAAQAQDDCRQALALGLDVSGSVDAREYRLQLEGVVAALDAYPVRTALLALPASPVELLVFEWSGTGDQHVLVDWIAIRDPADIVAIQDQLRAARRRETSPGTAIGDALAAGQRLLDQRATCALRTLDISGDGKSNLGPAPAQMRDGLAEAGITVNGLVVGAEAPGLGDLKQAEIGELTAYFRANVIAGPDAFVETARGYDEYAEAMARKLERELDTVTVSSLERRRQHPVAAPAPIVPEF